MVATIVYLVVIALVAVVVWALFYHRFYQKSGADTALIRTGSGGRRVLVEGGCLVLPFLHQVQKVSMRAVPVPVRLTGANSVLTSDRLRVDLEMEFLVRIDPAPENVAIAAQALGSRVTRSEELASFIEGHLMDAMQSSAATCTMDRLHEDRQSYVNATRAVVTEVLARLGLILEAASLRHVNQTSFSAFDENNAFDAVGMRRLSEVIAENRKERVRIETETDVMVRQSRLEQTRRQLEIERQQKHYEVELRRQSEEMDASAEAEIARMKAASESASASARIESEQSTKEAEIARDHALRRREMDAMLDLETKKIDQSITLAGKRADETAAEAQSEAARVAMVEATEDVQLKKELAAAKRTSELALVKAREESAVEHEKTQSHIHTILAVAQAESDAQGVRTRAEKEKQLAESEAKRAHIQAENETSPELMEMKVKMHHLDKMPEVMTQMMKPVEKIESIRINHIGGLGGGGAKGGEGGGGSPLNQAMESILGMAVQLPALKSMGDEIGLDIDAGLAGRVVDSASRAAGRMTERPSSSDSDSDTDNQ